MEALHMPFTILFSDRKQVKKRRHRPWDRSVKRRREIEAHAKHVGAADTEDFPRWLIAWVWHNRTSKDQIGAVIAAAQRMGGVDCIITTAEAIEIIDEAAI